MEKKRYDKPGLTKVKLIVEEIGTTACKISSGSAGPSSTCSGGNTCKSAGGS